MELSEGTEIKLLNGKVCTIDKELGRGGQGIVYLVDYCGGDYALKWYTKDYSNDFYKYLPPVYRESLYGLPDESAA